MDYILSLLKKKKGRKTKETKQKTFFHKNWFHCLSNIHFVVFLLAYGNKKSFRDTFRHRDNHTDINKESHKHTYISIHSTQILIREYQSQKSEKYFASEHMQYD